jgi:uncharacterized SAM-binding protein YcdF (DUF218 family)
MRRWLRVLLLVLAVWLAVVVGQTVSEIERQAIVDEARASDVIVTLGAAEYNGRPSPVLRLRLNHALELWREGYAPLIMTTGGAGGDPRYTEGIVGRDYLVQQGVPSEQIIVEEQSESTVQTIIAASEIMRRMGLKSAILVSDGYHIFRAKRILEQAGMTVYGSPRSGQPESVWREHWLATRQACGYLLWRIGITI